MLDEIRKPNPAVGTKEADLKHMVYMYFPILSASVSISTTQFLALTNRTIVAPNPINGFRLLGKSMLELSRGWLRFQHSEEI